MQLVLFMALTCAFFLSGCAGSVITGSTDGKVASGTLVASTSNLAFGTVGVGQTASATVNLQNQGAASVQISQLNVSGQFFSSAVSQASLPLTIAANSSYSLTVQFNPGATGAVAGQLTVTSNASNGSSAAVTFSGTGVPVPSAVNCTSGAFTGAGTDNCTVTLNAAAASGGLTVVLTSNSAAVTVPSTVFVPEGQTSASFTATIATVPVAQSVSVTANVAGISQSYALELGAVVPILSVNTSSVAFGSVSVNSPATQSVMVTSKGTAPVTVSGAKVTGNGFSVVADSLPMTLNPNQTATLTVRFDPTVAGAASGSLTLTSNSSTGTSTVIAFSGAGVPVLTGLTCSSSSITSAGTDYCPVTLNVAAGSGGFTVGISSNNSAVTVPSSITIPAGQTSAGFTATVSSVSTAQSVTLTASVGGTTKAFALQLGSTVPTLSISAASIAFGNVSLNTPTALTVALTSTGTGSVTVNSATVTGTGFSLSGTTFPLTLNPNQSVTLSVQFDPTVAGAATGSLTIVSTSSTNPTTVVSLSGTGQQTTAYEVDLSWDAPTNSSDQVAGYDVYRAVSGSSAYQLLNPSVNSSTSYTDTTVADNTSYTYYIESVDAEGNQSVPSNSFTVSIP